MVLPGCGPFGPAGGLRYSRLPGRCPYAFGRGGQEFLWRNASDKCLKPLDALKVYALKTAPAFEAALFTGARLAGDTTHMAEPLRNFARNIGVAFQILNDLNDWQGDQDNKLQAGGDVLGGRPTLLWRSLCRAYLRPNEASCLA